MAKTDKPASGTTSPDNNNDPDDKGTASNDGNGASNDAATASSGNPAATPIVETNTDKPVVETATAKPAGKIEAGKATPNSQAKDAERVTVKPIRTFHDSETGKHVTPDSKPFECSRRHAVELRVNGLVEFASESDEHAAISEQVRAQAAKNAERAKQGGIADKDKGTPLKNPKLNY